MKYGLITFLILALVSCSTDEADSASSSNLNGKWVDLETQMDTLSFELLGNKNVMNLNRGKEMRDGHLLPKPASGAYAYELSDSKISLYWMLSSNSGSNDYYFKIDDNKLDIGNFYGSEFGEILTFEKID